MADVYYTYNGRLVYDLSKVPATAVVQKHYRLLGGKGGFGSMLRAIGSQIEKTTNREMCRDLSGRRMRDVNMEAKLKEWYAKASEREREKMEKYHQRSQKRKETLEKGPLADHKFSDREYNYQKRKISYELQSALDAAVASILNEKHSTDSSSATTSTNTGEPVTKRARPWLEKLDYSSTSSNTSIDSDSDRSELGDSSTASVPAAPTWSVQVEKSLDRGQDGDSEFCPEACSAEANSYHGTESNAPNLSDTAMREHNSATAECAETAAELAPNNSEKPSNKPLKPTVDPLTDAELKECKTPFDLERFGLNILKESLSCRGLKCGGTLPERCARLFAVKDLAPDEYPVKLRAKPK